LPHIDRDTPDGNLEGNLDALCDGAVIFSDGTLGPYSQTANLKHGGWGWCSTDHSGTVLLAEYGLLEGDVQTAPRAELRALLASFNRTPRGASITIRVDASYLLGIREDPQAKARADNGDMWSECWRLILQKQLRVNVVKIARSHATQAMVDVGIISEHDRTGNDHADKYAERGAALSKVTPQQVADTRRIDRDARYVQLRLAHASALHTVGTRGNRPRATPPPPHVREKRKTALDHITRLKARGHALTSTSY
jgi:ribonuclease HI